jgi:hypothetical protein
MSKDRAFRGEYPLHIMGMDFVLRYDMNAIIEVEKEFDGKPLHEITQEEFSSMRGARVLLYAGLAHYNERGRGKKYNFTLEKCGRMLNLENIIDIYISSLRAITIARGSSKEEAERLIPIPKKIKENDGDNEEKEDAKAPEDPPVAASPGP